MADATRTEHKECTYRDLTVFFVPLALQAMSQGGTHAIIAMVASRGPGGVLNYAGLAQAFKVMLFLTSFGAGLITTGMVYGKTRGQFRIFHRVFRRVMIAIILLHLLCTLPPVSHTIFGRLMGLPPSIEEAARLTFLLIVPLSLLFMSRIPAYATLFVHKKTGMAYVATIGRIVVTIALAIAFVMSGLVGVVWAVVCMSLPVIIELVWLSRMARPFIENLPGERPGKKLPHWTEVLNFSFMFSIGKLFITLSGWLLAAVIARASRPEIMLSVFSLTTSIVGPIAFGVSRIQALYVSFHAELSARRKMVRFALVAGLVMGALPLLFILPGVGRLYYVVLQNIPPAEMRLVRLCTFALVPFPILVALRSCAEGIAAARKKPVAVLAGQSAYLGITATTAVFALIAGASGVLIGPLGLWTGNLASGVIIMLSLKWDLMYRFKKSIAALWLRD